MMMNRTTGPRPPWIDAELTKLMKSRHRAWRRYRQFPNELTYNRYKRIRNICNSEKKRKRQHFEQSMGMGGNPSGMPPSSPMGDFPHQFAPYPSGRDGPPMFPGRGHPSSEMGPFEPGFYPHGRPDPYDDAYRFGDRSPREWGDSEDEFDEEDNGDYFDEGSDEEDDFYPENYHAFGSAANISVYEPNPGNAQKRSAANMPMATGSKKSKANDDQESANPSRVLFIRNLPFDVTENEFGALAAPFGIITNMVLTKSGGFGLIEMSNQSVAEEMVNYYKNVYSPMIRGAGPVVVTYSRYPSLKVDGPNQLIAEGIANANKQFVSTRTRDSDNERRRVIRVQVFQPPPGYQARYMDFYRHFSNFGNILRIVTFKSGAVPNALIEYEGPAEAHVALLQTDGAAIEMPDAGYRIVHCPVRVEFSRQTSIDVRSDDDNGRDFVRHPIPGNRRARASPPPPSRRSLNGSKTDATSAKKLPADDILALLTEERLAQLSPSTLSELASRMVKPLLKAALNVGEQQAGFIKSQAEVLDRLAPQQESHTGDTKPVITSGSTSSATSQVKSPVVFVSNLVPQRVNADALFRLFGVYGDVLRVKILPVKNESALIQFGDVTQAQRACQFLDKAPLYGKEINCSLSKNTSVAILVPSKEDSDVAAESIWQTNRDYTGHPLHRFRWASPATVQQLCKPSKFLSVSNLPEGVSEEDLTDAFQQKCGCQIVSLKLTKSGKVTNALAEMEDVEHAVMALIAMHDFELDTKCHMKITFAKPQ